MQWYSKYVGIPWRSLGSDFDGCDCWGLVVLVLRDHFGIEVPAHDELRVTAQKDGKVEPSVFAAEFEPVDDAAPGDVLHMWGVFGTKRLPIHAGVVVGRNTVLHIERDDTTSCVIRTDRNPNIWRPIQAYRVRR